MHHFVEWFERFTYLVLIVFLVVVLLFTLLELGWLTFIGLFEVTPLRLESPELF